jgi:hypothetical protein
MSCLHLNGDGYGEGRSGGVEHDVHLTLLTRDSLGTVGISKKPGFAMSLWLHGKEDFISEAGAMNIFIIKEAKDGCMFPQVLQASRLMESQFSPRIHDNAT